MTISRLQGFGSIQKHRKDQRFRDGNCLLHPLFWSGCKHMGLQHCQSHNDHHLEYGVRGTTIGLDSYPYLWSPLRHLSCLIASRFVHGSLSLMCFFIYPNPWVFLVIANLVGSINLEENGILAGSLPALGLIVPRWVQAFQRFGSAWVTGNSLVITRMRVTPRFFSCSSFLSVPGFTW